MPFASARHSLMLVLPTSKRSAVRECVMAATFTSLRRKFKGGRCSLPRIGAWTSGSRVRAGVDETAKNSGPVRGRRHSVAAENRPFMRRRIPVSETIDGGQPDLRTAYRHLAGYFPGGAVILHEGRVVLATTDSEERRVGKECRSRWSPYH